MTGTLDGRVVIVTGSGRGLGREHALLLASRGARVVVNDLADGSSNPGEEVVAEIRAAGGEAIADAHSVTTWESAQGILESALTAYGRLDGLVCNAGFLRDRMLVNMTDAEWDDIVKVHQYGTFYILRHAAEHWRARHKAGESVNAGVVMTTAISGLHSNVGQVNYGAAKAAIALMAISSARELERYGVRVNAISPLARTRLTMTTPAGAAPADGGFDEMHPKHASPLVAWLLSAECRATAQVYGVFGRHIHRYNGWTAAESIDTDEDWTVEHVEKALAGWPEAYEPSPVPGIPAHA